MNFNKKINKIFSEARGVSITPEQWANIDPKLIERLALTHNFKPRFAAFNKIATILKDTDPYLNNIIRKYYEKLLTKGKGPAGKKEFLNAHRELLVAFHQACRDAVGEYNKQAATTHGKAGRIMRAKEADKPTSTTTAMMSPDERAFYFSMIRKKSLDRSEGVFRIKNKKTGTLMRSKEGYPITFDTKEEAEEKVAGDPERFPPGEFEVVKDRNIYKGDFVYKIRDGNGNFIKSRTTKKDISFPSENEAAAESHDPQNTIMWDKDGYDTSNLEVVEVENDRSLRALEKVIGPANHGWTREEMVNALMPIILRFARKFKSPKAEMDDLINHGVVAALKQIDSDAAIAPLTVHARNEISKAIRNAATVSGVIKQPYRYGAFGNVGPIIAWKVLYKDPDDDEDPEGVKVARFAVEMSGKLDLGMKKATEFKKELDNIGVSATIEPERQKLVSTAMKVRSGGEEGDDEGQEIGKSIKSFVAKPPPLVAANKEILNRIIDKAGLSPKEREVIDLQMGFDVPEAGMSATFRPGTETHPPGEQAGIGELDPKSMQRAMAKELEIELKKKNPSKSVSVSDAEMDRLIKLAETDNDTMKMLSIIRKKVLAKLKAPTRSTDVVRGPVEIAKILNKDHKTVVNTLTRAKDKLNHAASELGFPVSRPEAGFKGEREIVLLANLLGTDLDTTKEVIAKAKSGDPDAVDLLRQARKMLTGKHAPGLPYDPKIRTGAEKRKKEEYLRAKYLDRERDLLDLASVTPRQREAMRYYLGLSTGSKSSVGSIAAKMGITSNMVLDLLKGAREAMNAAGADLDLRRRSRLMAGSFEEDFDPIRVRYYVGDEGLSRSALFKLLVAAHDEALGELRRGVLAEDVVVGVGGLVADWCRDVILFRFYRGY